MHATWTKFVTLIVFILLLSACVAPQMPPSSVPTGQPPNITKMRLLFMDDGERKWPEPLEVHAVLMDENDLRKTLGILISGDIPRSQNLGELIRIIRTSNERAEGLVPGLTGLGGVYGHAFLDLAEKALSDGVFNPLQQVIVSVFGQITHYEFHQNSQNPTGNGALEVITYVTSETVLPGQGVKTLQTEAYRWKVRVVNDGFKIVPHSGNDNDPFPKTMAFTPEMLARVKVRGYMYKLWAKGTVIKIDLIEKRQGTNWIPLSKTDPQYAKLYAEVDENCIDMMFVQAPPTSLGGLKPPLYCLGRCQNPMIVNTGE